MVQEYIYSFRIKGGPKLTPASASIVKMFIDNHMDRGIEKRSAEEDWTKFCKELNKDGFKVYGVTRVPYVKPERVD